MVRFGPTTVAPLDNAPSSASYVSYGMLAPRPTKNATVVVLFACFTLCSAESAATVVVTVYLPLTAVQVPSLAEMLPPLGMTPLGELVRVFTVAPVESLMLTVTPCVALDEGWLPWFVTAV